MTPIFVRSSNARSLLFNHQRGLTSLFQKKKQEMECIIPAGNFKGNFCCTSTTIYSKLLAVISKAIQALSRIGDELCFQAKPEHLSLITVNMSRTAFVTFDFLDVFFSSYAAKETNLEEDNCTCKMSMKSIAGIFRMNKDRRVGKCVVLSSLRRFHFLGGTM